MRISNYFQPTELEECFYLMQKYPDYRIIAGGTDLLVKLFSNDEVIDCLIDIGNINGMHGIIDNQRELIVGALNTHGHLAEENMIHRWTSVLAQACKTIGSPQIRNVATIGGNIVNASPAADGVAALYALDAQVEISSQYGKRVVAINNFIRDPGSTTLQKGEVLTRIIIPKCPEQHYDHYYFKSGQRKSLAIAKVSLAAIVKMDPPKTIDEIRLAYGAVGPTVIKARRCEEFLTGRLLDDNIVTEACKIVSKEVTPINDIRSTAGYRKYMTGHFLKTMLQKYLTSC